MNMNKGPGRESSTAAALKWVLILIAVKEKGSVRSKR